MFGIHSLFSRSCAPRCIYAVCSIVEANAISLACYYNEDSSLLSTRSFIRSNRFKLGSFYRACKSVCVCIHFNWIYIVSLFAVVFNSFRRSRQPFIHMQFVECGTEHHFGQQHQHFKNSRFVYFERSTFINASIDSNAYLNF